MIFDVELQYLSDEIKTSKVGNTYHVFKFLDENDTVTCISEDVNLNCKLNRLDPCTCTFSLNFGQYTNLKLIEISNE